MSKKNFYEALGVDRKASEDDIKKAYRKLVRKYHPDVSKEPDAEQKISEINEAYETLKDSKKRADYDAMLDNPFAGFAGGQGGGGFGGFGGFGNGGGGRFNQDSFGGDGFDFADLFRQFGGGFGGNAAGGGGGSNTRSRQQDNSNKPYRGMDQNARLTVDLQSAYDGGERQLSFTVPVEGEDGRVRDQNKTLKVRIPKGIKAGQQIRLAGQGLPGFNGGPAGDLFLEIQFAQDPNLRIEDLDVYQKVPISPWEAALGGTVAVNTPAGRLEVKIPENTETGKQLRVKGKGIPAKEPGNLYLEMEIMNPEVKTASDREAYEALAKHFSNYNPSR